MSFDRILKWKVAYVALFLNENENENENYSFWKLAYVAVHFENEDF